MTDQYKTPTQWEPPILCPVEASGQITCYRGGRVYNALFCTQIEKRRCWDERCEEAQRDRDPTSTKVVCRDCRHYRTVAMRYVGGFGPAPDRHVCLANRWRAFERVNEITGQVTTANGWGTIALAGKVFLDCELVRNENCIGECKFEPRHWWDFIIVVMESLGWGKEADR